jgi:hypothetical protein
MPRPLLICDADEVLVKFASTFESFIALQGWTLSLDSFALHGNIRDAKGDAASQDIISALLADFFETSVESCPAVAGAADALSDIAKRADVLVLTNAPAAQRARREASLASLGMPYKVFANEGLKGKAVKELVADRKSPIAFVDDMPFHHTSVAEHAARVHRLHLIAEPRLQTLLPKAIDAHARIDSWAEAHPHLNTVLFG